MLFTVYEIEWRPLVGGIKMRPHCKELDEVEAETRKDAINIVALKLDKAHGNLRALSCDD